MEPHGLRYTKRDLFFFLKKICIIIGYYKFIFFQELVWQIINDLDVKTSKNVPLYARSPFVEVQGLFSDDILKILTDQMNDTNVTQKKEHFKSMLNSVEMTENMKSPRIIKTHLPIDMLPPNLLGVNQVEMKFFLMMFYFLLQQA